MLWSWSGSQQEIVSWGSHHVEDPDQEPELGPALGSGVDVAVDSGVDVTVDSEVDVPVVSWVDVAVDSGLETGVDSRVERGVVSVLETVDSGLETGVDSRVETGVVSVLETDVVSGVENGDEAGRAYTAVAAMRTRTCERCILVVDKCCELPVNVLAVYFELVQTSVAVGMK